MSYKKYKASYDASKERQKAKDPRKFAASKIFRERRRVALLKELPFEITLEYVLNLPSETCPILGHNLEWGTGSPHTASLDRLIPELGYIEGNVQWVSWRANTLKNSATKEESEKLHEWFQRNTG